MAVTKADVLLIAPELSEVDDARFAAAIADALLQMNTEALGARADLVLKYLVAHLVSLGEQGGSEGTVTSETVGGVSRTYSAAATGGGETGTSYGDEYKRLLRLFSPRVVVL